MPLSNLTPARAALARRGLLAFELAVRIAGDQTRFSKLIGATDQKVSHWKLRDNAIPLEWVPRIVAAIRHPLITPYSLRPDLASFWDLLAPQLADCAVGSVRRRSLTPSALQHALRPYQEQRRALPAPHGRPERDVDQPAARRIDLSSSDHKDQAAL